MIVKCSICIKIFCKVLIILLLSNYFIFAKCQINAKSFSQSLLSNQIIKANPHVLTENLSPNLRGVNLFYETTTGIRNLTAQIKMGMAQQQNNVDTLTYFEMGIHPRYYSTAQLKYFYVSPGLSLFSTGDYAWSVSLGFQIKFLKRLILDNWLSLNRTTSIQNYEAKTYLRAGFSLGMLIIKTEYLK